MSSGGKARKATSRIPRTICMTLLPLTCIIVYHNICHINQLSTGKPMLFKYIKKSIVIIGIISISGCATMSKEECQMANWQALGQADGAQGKLPDYISKRSKNCVKNGIQPNQVLWEKGRKEGLKDYCKANNVYAIGRKGKDLSPVCGYMSKSEYNTLMTSHKDGLKLYRFEKSIDRKREHLNKLQAEKNKVGNKKLSFGSGLEYLSLDKQIKELKAEIERDEAELKKMEK